MKQDSIKETLKERGSRYGEFKDFAEISQELKSKIPIYLTTEDEVINEGLEMIMHKIARILNGDPFYDDSWRDIAGYSLLVVEYIKGLNNENK